jgi:hypothetical protein
MDLDRSVYVHMRFGRKDGEHPLLQQCITIFLIMHPAQVLLEVIQPGPSLVRPWAIFPEAKVHHLRTTLRFFVVDTFLVASQVVDGAKALFARTVGLITLEELSMACLVFPGRVSRVAAWAVEVYENIPLI